jgi:hypothetical protein
MLPPRFNYALLRLQRPTWVPEWDFDVAVNMLRAAQVLTDLVDVGGSVRRDSADPEFWLLLVSVAEKLECWLRFRWKEPDASDLTVVVQEKR